jgi:hypothetical protein
MVGEAGTNTQVPLDRAAGSTLQVRLLWYPSGSGTGNVVWRVGFRTASPGENLDAAPPTFAGAPVVAAAAGDSMGIETVALEIPADAVDNGDPLILRILRDGADATDTLVVNVRLYLVEIRYTATG